MKEDKKIDFKTLISIGVYAIILIVSMYLLQHMKNGIIVFILLKPGLENFEHDFASV